MLKYICLFVFHFIYFVSMYNSLAEAAKLDSDIRKIRQEMGINNDKLQAAKEKMNQRKKNIGEKERVVEQLQEQVSQIQAENDDDHLAIKQKTNELKKYREQIRTIEQLIELFKEKMAQYNGDEPKPLNCDNEQKVLGQLEHILLLLNAEYTCYDLSEFQNELQEIQKCRKAIQHELTVLKQFAKDWEPQDNMDLLIDEFAARSAISDTESPHRLSELSIPICNDRPVLLEHVPKYDLPLPPKIDDFQKSIQDFIDRESIHSDIEKRIFTDQLNFLTALRDKLIDSPVSDVDLNNFEEQITNRIKMMEEIKEARLLKISKPNLSEPQVDPITLVVSQFLDFYDIIKEEINIPSLTEGIQNEVEDALKLPTYQAPPVPKALKKTTQSNELAEFSVRMQKLSQEMQENITFDGDILIPSERTPISNDTSALQNIMNEYPINKPIPSDILGDDEEFSNFQKLYHEKLPSTLSDLLDNTQFVLDDKEDEAEIPSALDDFIEPNEFSTNLHRRSIELNNLLKGFNDLEFPPTPRIKEPKEVKIDLEPYDQSLVLSSINQLLSPNQQNTVMLSDEIAELKAKLNEVNSQIAEEDQDCDFNEDELLNLKRENAELLQTIESQKKENNECVTEIRKLIETRKSLIKEQEELSAKLESAHSSTSNVAELQATLEEKRKELEGKKAAFEIEKEDWIQMIMMTK